MVSAAQKNEAVRCAHLHAQFAKLLLQFLERASASLGHVRLPFGRLELLTQLVELGLMLLLLAVEAALHEATRVHEAVGCASQPRQGEPSMVKSTHAALSLRALNSVLLDILRVIWMGGVRVR